MSTSVLEGASGCHGTEYSISKQFSSFFTATRIITSHSGDLDLFHLDSMLALNWISLSLLLIPSNSLYQITRHIFLKCETDHVTPQFSMTFHCNENKTLTLNPALVYYFLSLSVSVHSGCYNRTCRVNG